MLKDDKILIGKNSEKELFLLLDKANRHGLITGSSGSGKTITLKVLAESFSRCWGSSIYGRYKRRLSRNMSVRNTNRKFK